MNSNHGSHAWRSVICSEQAVVLCFVLDDVAAEVEDRFVEQVLLHQVKDVQDSTGSSISVVKRVDRLELIVTDGELDQRVQAVLIGVEKSLKV